MADIGCGTGYVVEVMQRSLRTYLKAYYISIWLTELARAYPRVHFCGLDINLSQAPPEQWRPNNLRFENVDVLKTLPDHLCGHFE